MWPPAPFTCPATTSPDRRRPPAAATVLALLTFALAPHWLLPTGGGRELHWASWRQAAGDSYALIALAALTHAAITHLPPRPKPRNPGTAGSQGAPHDQNQDRHDRKPVTTLAPARAYSGWP